MKLEIMNISEGHFGQEWMLVEPELEFDNIDQVLDWMKDNDFEMKNVTHYLFNEWKYCDEYGIEFVYRLVS